MNALVSQPDTLLHDYTHLPVMRELPADLESPVSVYLKLAGAGPSFLLESVTGGEQVARYSFIGVNPCAAYVLRGDRLEEHSPSGMHIRQLPPGANPLSALKQVLEQIRPAPAAGLPRFAGGLVGYLGYEAAARFEPSIPLPAASQDDEQELPEAIFLLADTLVAFDHAYGKLLLIANNPIDPDQARPSRPADERLDELQAAIQRPLAIQPEPHKTAEENSLQSNFSQAAFEAGVRQAKEHIAAGDIFQVVVSQRLSRQTSADAFNIYRALRRTNPSPYMFYFNFDSVSAGQPLRLIGASPEMHVRLEGRTALVRPIAGTRPRAATPAGNTALQAELLADPKERAEHIMLVDLARNDLGRVCEFGSVSVKELMAVEHYSHVMHIVSQVQGSLRPEFDAFDLMKATFPAGTVSGAPKIRAMQIIADLEGERRGAYAGAVGYFSFDGSMDTCITIRTLVMQADRISIQAGAGIVADSDPEMEYRETLNKARALLVAVEVAEAG